MTVAHGAKLTILLAGMLALSACEEVVTSPRPEIRVPVVAPTEPPLREVQPSARSGELASYYEDVQSQLLTRGLLRKDGGGPDTPFAQRDLVRNFVQIAAFSEQSLVNGEFRANGAPNPIRRWTKPVRVQLDFGQTASPALRRDVTATVTAYLNRLGRFIGQPITLTETSPNFIVAVLNVDELDRYAKPLQQRFPDIPPPLARQMTELDRTDHCVVYSFERAEQPNRIQSAVAIIRSEHPKLLRDKCLHEEIAQGLGLTNDSPAARPSIFNDDDEFAFLTSHDELLLKMLYDPRLPLGAGPQETQVVAEVIASELLGGES